MPRRPSKYVREINLQGKYEGRWEDLSAYNSGCRKDALADLRAYRVAEPGTEFRIITRRVLRQPEVNA